MDKLSRYYPILISVALAMLTNFGAAVVATDALALFLFLPREIPINKRVLSKKPGKKPSKSAVLKGDIKKILGRNLFCSTCDPISLEDLFKSKTEIEEKKLASLDNAILISTMVDDVAKYSLAFVSVTEPEILTIRVGLGDKVGSAEVISIEDKKVTFIKDGKEMVLNLLGETTVKVEKKKKPGGKKNKLADIISKIKKIGENKYEIDKSVVQDLMKNFAAAGRGARIVPDVKGGFKASFVRHYSLFYKLGVRSGDVIKSVNNIPLNSIQETLILYTKLKNATHLTMSLDRRGKSVNMDYTIR
jgi:hypothetical protein